MSHIDQSLKRGREAWDEFESKLLTMMQSESQSAAASIEGHIEDVETDNVLQDGSYELCEGETNLMITGVIYMCLSNIDSFDRLRLFGDRLQGVDLFANHPIWLVALAFAGTGDDEYEDGSTLRKWAPYICELATIKGLSTTYIINVLTSKYGFKAYLEGSFVFEPNFVTQFTMNDWTVILNHDDVSKLLSKHRVLVRLLRDHPYERMKMINQAAAQ